MKTFALVGLLASAAALAQTSPESERTRIDAERAQAQARYAEEEKACYARFAVNDCLNEARARRRAVLADLRQQEIALDDAQRRRRSLERQQEMLERASPQRQQQEAERRARARAEREEREKQATQKAARRPGPAPEADPKQDGAVAAPAPKPRGAAREPEPPVRKTIDTQRNTRGHEERLSEAARHKARVQQKEQARKEPVRPLPVPP